MARKSGVNRDEQEVFLSELARTGSVRRACKVSGLTRSAVRKLKLKEDFAIRYADAVEDSIDLIEEVGYRHARSGDERLIRYLLDAKRYKKEKEGVGITATPSITVTIGG